MKQEQSEFKLNDFDKISLNDKFSAVHSNFRKRRVEQTYKIYPITRINSLIALLQKRNKEQQLDSFDEDYSHKARYIMDNNFNMWFALEGEAFGDIPSHVAMTGQEDASATCIAAGNITFSQDYEKIIGISNKSGHFKPYFNSVQWALVALYLNLHKTNLSFERTLIFENHDESPVIDIQFQYNGAAIQDWVKGFFKGFSDDEIQKKLKEQPLETKIVTITPDRNIGFNRGNNITERQQHTLSFRSRAWNKPIFFSDCKLEQPLGLISQTNDSNLKSPPIRRSRLFSQRLAFLDVTNKPQIKKVDKEQKYPKDSKNKGPSNNNSEKKNSPVFLERVGYLRT